MLDRVNGLKDHDLYYFNQPVTELHGGSKAVVRGRQMLIFASYSYLSLIGHPRIHAAAKETIGRFGAGTRGVRLLAGTLDLHYDREATIAQFKNAEEATCFSGGNATILTAISTLVGRRGAVILDKLDHASLVDGCILSGADFRRFKRNDMNDLERVLKRLELGVTKLVVVDAVFSMDGDIVDLPSVVERI